MFQLYLIAPLAYGRLHRLAMVMPRCIAAVFCVLCSCLVADGCNECQLMLIVDLNSKCFQCHRVLDVPALFHWAHSVLLCGLLFSCCRLCQGVSSAHNRGNLSPFKGNETLCWSLLYIPVYSWPSPLHLLLFDRIFKYNLVLVDSFSFYSDIVFWCEEYGILFASTVKLWIKEEFIIGLKLFHRNLLLLLFVSMLSGSLGTSAYVWIGPCCSLQADESHQVLSGYH